MPGVLQHIICPRCGADMDAKMLARHLRFSAERPLLCACCGEEVTNDPGIFRALVAELPKHRIVKRRRPKKRKLFNLNPKTMAEAERIDRRSRGKKSKSIRTTSGGAFESNKRRH